MKLSQFKNGYVVVKASSKDDYRYVMPSDTNALGVVWNGVLVTTGVVQVYVYGSVQYNQPVRTRMQGDGGLPGMVVGLPARYSSAYMQIGTALQSGRDKLIPVALNIRYMSSAGNASPAPADMSIIKADPDIASAISLRHASGSDNQDLSGLQPKETGKGLSTNDLTAELKSSYDGAVSHALSAHAPSGATVGADWNTNVTNRPTIPESLSQLSDDSTHRTVTDTEKAAWNGKQDALGFTPATNNHTHTGTYEAANANIQAHVTAAHAPSNAQKNSDITKGEIEAKLTGEISTHTHAGGGGGLTQSQILARQL